MTEQERNLIRDAMMFAVKDITGRVMREATVQSMIDDFKKAINYTHCCESDSEQLSCSTCKWLKRTDDYCDSCFKFKKHELDIKSVADMVDPFWIINNK